MLLRPSRGATWPTHKARARKRRRGLGKDSRPTASLDREVLAPPSRSNDLDPNALAEDSRTEARSWT